MITSGTLRVLLVGVSAIAAINVAAATKHDGAKSAPNPVAQNLSKACAVGVDAFLADQERNTKIQDYQIRDSTGQTQVVSRDEFRTTAITECVKHSRDEFIREDLPPAAPTPAPAVPKPNSNIPGPYNSDLNVPT